ncbi:MAG: hypothetical protein JWN01_1017 [Patescibacteria group bacterium]|nr:hypothetical protein [Patescibacteria group bacterium]
MREAYGGVLPDRPEGTADSVGGEAAEPSSFYGIEAVEDGYFVTKPALYSDMGAVGATTVEAAPKGEAEAMIARARAELDPQTEMASLRQSFSGFHSIAREPDGSYIVTVPAFHSLDQPGLSVGTAKKSFSDWTEAKNYYLESRNQREYPPEAVFGFAAGETTRRFVALEQFGRTPHLADAPREIPEETKRVLDFDARNNPTGPSAATYQKTMEMPGWESQVFNFVENYAKTPEGVAMAERLGINNLRLLTPGQAANLSLEVITRLKKYNLDDMASEDGETAADQAGVLALLNRGLRERDSDDFKGNGICRNFASGVKVVFDALKTNQTTFNYLQDTYAFYESGTRSDFDPAYEAADRTRSVSMKQEVVTGHAWNSFVTLDEKGAAQTIADATWSTIDYDTGRPVQLDYTMQRMEREVYRNSQSEETRPNADETASFYLYLIDSLPQQEGLVLDDETVARVRQSSSYQGQIDSLKERYPGLSSEQYDEFALEVHKKIADQQAVASKTQFYATRVMGVVRGHEAEVSDEQGKALVRLVAEVKQDVSYSEVQTVYALPTERANDRIAVVRKYVQGWEAASKSGYVPVGGLRFADQQIQQIVLEVCSPETKRKLESWSR